MSLGLGPAASGTWAGAVTRAVPARAWPCQEAQPPVSRAQASFPGPRRPAAADQFLLPHLPIYCNPIRESSVSLINSRPRRVSSPFCPRHPAPQPCGGEGAWVRALESRRFVCLSHSTSVLHLPHLLIYKYGNQ